MLHTHRGNCQLCLRPQAVNPKTGLLAQHGYHLKYGFFSGVCQGSDHVPLNVSCEFLKSVADDMDRRLQANSVPMPTAELMAEFVIYARRRCATWRAYPLFSVKVIEQQIARRTQAQRDSIKAEREAQKTAKEQRAQERAAKREATKTWSDKMIANARRKAEQILSQGQTPVLTSRDTAGTFAQDRFCYTLYEVDQWLANHRDTGKIEVGIMIELR